MSYFNKFGGIWGQIPVTAGRIFWVSPGDTYTVEGRTYTASDNNDGLSPERALRTIDYTVGLTTASAGDVIVLLPGAHSSAATITLDIAGITITGVPGATPIPGSHMNGGPARNRCSVTNTATAGFIFTVSADDVEIAWIDLIPVAAGGRGIYAQAGADRLFVHDCTFSMIAAAATSTYGVALGTVATGVNEDTVIRNCYFQSGSSAQSGANGGGVVAINTVYGLSIENCTFINKGTAAWAIAVQTISTVGNWSMRDCDFLASSLATSLITTAVNSAGTVDGSAQLYRCYFAGLTDAATSAVSIDLVLAECYLASNAGGALAANS